MRCVHCGDIVDHVIILNRRRRRHPKPSRGRPPIYGNNPWKQNKPALV
jgi:hypothetical protein